MPYAVVSFEATPNPNALKCILDRPISDGPRSFLNAQSAREDPLARALFGVEGVACILLNGGWITVNKRPEAAWAGVKAGVRLVLRDAE